ncbi:MAG: glycosyltransferase [Xanthomonadaceae bacterium]|nr:glycosyltransferase [Xanthomonadaceae bacterium]
MNAVRTAIHTGLQSRSSAGLPASARVAVVHDWLNVVGGAERVLEQILQVFPGADVYTLTDTLPEADRGFLGSSRVTVSMIGRTPWLRSHHRLALPLMPTAIESFDLTGYDLVLSSSFAVAKGAIVRPDALHVCYCHSPMRYIWDLEHAYRRDAGLDRGLRGVATSLLMSYLRTWDVASAHRAHVLIANSRFTAARIRRYWNRDAIVLPPPVDISRFTPQAEKDDAYLTVSRLVPYKRHDLMVQAFAAMPDRRLRIVGDGPMRESLQRNAPPNVEFLGALPDTEVAALMARARAFVFAAHEDFGIVPVEAQASGTPVIAYGAGGVLDTVRPWPDPDASGVFFEAQTPESLAEAVRRFEDIASGFDARVLRTHAERYGNAQFRATLIDVVDQAWEQARRAAAPVA